MALEKIVLMSMGSKCDIPNLWVNAIFAEFMNSGINVKSLMFLGRIATLLCALVLMSSLIAMGLGGGKIRNLSSIIWEATCKTQRTLEREEKIIRRKE